jgi:hypothetical protein
MMRTLVANEPRTYREALVHTLRSLRPRVEVGTVEPDGLDAEIMRLHPHLVVCSQTCATVQDGVLTWVTLYPRGENRAEVVTAGGRAMLVGIQFEDFLSIIDGTELLYRLA